eukprot:CAMPEP_0195607290 /NCGR_PEP_ID=MMETSP0815-20121206/8137_1 /TAXON_ID=97485 /ORGANISM="Prymnesium parvum, Strain Texoma1" /LENGTH=107 /DNA_ID=CAMNT_0040747083 /DNA_START=499 /DNA_END=818 /DNA_ORIENTATION=-
MSMMRRTMLPLRTTQRGAALWASFGNCRLKTFAWSIGSGSASSDGAPLWNTFPVRVCTTTAVPTVAQRRIPLARAWKEVGADDAHEHVVPLLDLQHHRRDAVPEPPV